MAPPAPPNEDIVPLHSLHSIPLSSFLHAPHDDDDDDGPDFVSSAHPVALYEKKLKKEAEFYDQEIPLSVKEGTRLCRTS